MSDNNPSPNSYFLDAKIPQHLSKKSAFKYLGSLFILSLIGAAVFFTHTQSNQTNLALKSFSDKSNELLDTLQELERQRLNLDNRLSDKEKELTQQAAHYEQFLSDVKDRLFTLETTLGIENTDPSFDGRIDTVNAHALLRTRMLQLIPNGTPIETYSKSSGYGSRTHPVTGDKRFHLGLDLSANVGTPVFATADGVIELARKSNKGYGNMLKIDHSFGFMTLYAHLNKINVKTGQFVQKGDLIAWSGNSGLSTGPHLHYEVRFLGRALNPSHFITWTLTNFDEIFEKEKTISWSELIKVIEHATESYALLTSDQMLTK